MAKNHVMLVFLGAVCILPPQAWGKKSTGKGPCDGPEDCQSGICIEIDGRSYCSRSCGHCPAGMYCDDKLFGMLNLKVCVMGSESSPAAPKTPPKIPCRTDDGCPGALVCAQMMGTRDCTIECTSDAQCEMPEMTGVKYSFMECGLDEGKRGRKACLPKRKCLANPMACISRNPKADEAPPKIEKPAIAAMSESRFQKLLSQVKESSFADERNAILETAARHNYFTCDQVGRVLDTISFADEKLSALRILAPRIVDKENEHLLISNFTFDDDKNKARGVLGR